MSSCPTTRESIVSFGRVIFHLGCLAWGATVALCSAASSQPRPNILFILTDDQSHRSVSCYPESYSWVKTPHIDRLAREGVRFAPSYIGANCIPARATLLTGLHPTGIETLRRSALAEAEKRNEGPVYWPRFFRQHGYQTAQIGKWHTDGHMGYGRDWDYQVVWSRLVGGGENNLNYQTNQLLSTNGGEPRRTPGYSTDNYTRWAVDYIRGANREASKPWYLWLCYDAPHGPFIPADRHKDQYADAPVPLPSTIFPPRVGKPGYMQTVETWIRNDDGVAVLRDSHYRADALLRQHAATQQFPRTYADWVRRYHRTVSALDDGVGALLQALDETGQRENTLIVFTSDQGLAVGQHGFFDKHAPYDANIAAPLIVSLPGRKSANSVCNVSVTGADLIPTFFRFAGIELPWRMHGHDLTPLLENPRAAWPHPSLLVYTIGSWGDDTRKIPDHAGDPLPTRGFRVPWWILLREGKFKYIRTLVHNETEELYDLQADPEENANLALDTSHRETLQSLRGATLAELRRIDAPFVEHLPPVRRYDETPTARP